MQISLSHLSRAILIKLYPTMLIKIFNHIDEWSFVLQLGCLLLTTVSLVVGSVSSKPLFIYGVFRVHVFILIAMGAVIWEELCSNDTVLRRCSGMY